MTKVKTPVKCLFLVFGLLAVMGCQTEAGPGLVEAGSGDWQVVYTSNFQGDKAPEWEAGGTPKIVNGALVVQSEEHDYTVVLKAPKVMGSVMVEFVVSGTGAKFSDLSPMLNAAADEFRSGYLLQFGGKGNTLDHLLKEGQEVPGTTKTAPLLTPGKTYHVVAINDAGNISLKVDGVEVFSYVDKTPLKGANNSQVGLYSYHSTVKIEKVTVWAKKSEPPATK
jgi:hypothetical protein